LISKPSSFAFDVAVSSAPHDSRVRRELERQLTLRLPSLPPLRPVWTEAATALLDAPRSTVLGKSARVVVVLHQQQWGKDEATKEDIATLKRRITAKGVDFLRVISLDGTPVPAWLKKAPTKSLAAGNADACADWVVEGIAAQGGAVRRPTDAPIKFDAVDDRSAQQRDAFLASHRAITHLGREFDRLAAEVTKRAATVNRDEAEVPLDVHRVPGRCTVQLGPVALTLSWVRTRPDTVGTGRLMIIEWEGQVGRPNVAAAPNPVVLRETVLRADATRVEDWQWRSEDVAGYAYDSTQLAAHCVDSLAYALQDRR
jgi:hypothetical protein